MSGQAPDMPDVDWQLAAYLAVFEKLLVDMLATQAALGGGGTEALVNYRRDLGEFIRRAKFPRALSDEEAAEYHLQCDVILDRMFRRATEFAPAVAAMFGVRP